MTGTATDWRVECSDAGCRDSLVVLSCGLGLRWEVGGARSSQVGAAKSNWVGGGDTLVESRCAVCRGTGWVAWAKGVVLQQASSGAGNGIGILMTLGGGALVGARG